MLLKLILTNFIFVFNIYAFELNQALNDDKNITDQVQFAFCTEDDTNIDDLNFVTINNPSISFSYNDNYLWLKVGL